jgi:hypothetical protein
MFGASIQAAMPLDLVVDRERRVIRMRGSGVLTDVDLETVRSKCDAIPEADRSFPRVCDLSAVTAVSVSTESLDGWAADPVSNPRVDHAVICNAPPVLERVLEFVQLSRKAFRNVSVFPTHEKAMDWLREEQHSVRY